jgi:phosphatidate cytidylyltransferase
VRTRIIVGLIALPFVVIPVWLGGVWIVALIVAIALVGGHEFYNLLNKGGYRSFYFIGMSWLALLTVQPWLSQWLSLRSLSPGLPLDLLLTTGFITLLIACLFENDQPLQRWLATSSVAVYLGLALSQGLGLRLLPHGLWWITLGVLITWSNDTCAYFVGTFLGRRKLWPRLSPKKTWEGTIGGWIGGSLMAMAIAWLGPLPLSLGWGTLLGFSASVLALFGDLSVSMVKRQIGVKDSGTLFPGHGGMLDRLDSALFVLPFIYQAAKLLLS